MRLTIRTRLLGSTAIALVSTLLVGLMGARGLLELSHTTDTVLLYNHAVRNQLEADMMHDALRADVLAALLAKDASDSKAVIEDVAHHAETLRSSMKANLALALEPEVLAHITEATKALEAYVSEAELIVRKASESRAAAEARLREFIASFEALEQGMKTVSDAIENDAKEAEKEGVARAQVLIRFIAGWTILAALVAGFASFRSTSRVIDGIGRIVEVARSLGRKDLTTRLAWDGEDEIAEAATGINAAIGEIRTVLETMRDNAQTVSGAARELTATADQLAVSSEVTSERATSVSASTEEVQQSSSVVASSTEEIAIGTQEVTRNVGIAAQVASDGVKLTAATRDALSKLGDSSTAIGAITDTISTIAQQTRMLALNANIEAARAGVAGKGFAVVAQEVKELARQTEDATVDIARKISAIKEDTLRAVSAVEGLSGAIVRVDELSQSLATTMEEQTATAQAISRTTTDVAKATSSMSNDVTQVAAAAEQSAAAAEQTRQSAAELLRLAESLEHTVAEFKLTETTSTLFRKDASTSAPTALSA